MMNSSKVVLGILGGVATGALLGILFAPEKGTRTRRKMIFKSNDFADDIRDKFEGLYSAATNKCENIVNDAREMASHNKIK